MELQNGLSMLQKLPVEEDLLLSVAEEPSDPGAWSYL